MCIRFCNDYPWYVNYPSDPVVHVLTSSVCGFACFSTGPAAHVCRLMNSLSVCWDAVTRTLKCYLLGLPTLQIKLFPSPQLQSKLRNLPAEAGSKQNVAQRPVLAAIHSAWLKSLSFPAINTLLPPTRKRQSKAVVRKWLERHCFSVFSN